MTLFTQIPSNQSLSKQSHCHLLGDIADIRLGHPFRGSVVADEAGDVQVIQMRDTQANGTINLQHLTKTKLNARKAPQWLRDGDLLLASKGARNHCALVENVADNTLCSPHFFVIRIKPECESMLLAPFLCWQLNQQPAQRYFSSSAEGSHYVSIRRQVLENTPIKLLDMPIQESIVALHRLTLAEEQTLQKLIDNRQQQLQGIAHALLSQ